MMSPTGFGKSGVRDGIVFMGVAQEKAQAFQGRKVGGQFQFTRDKTVYVTGEALFCMHSLETSLRVVGLAGIPGSSILRPTTCSYQFLCRMNTDDSRCPRLSV
jgi:hypothetical protein